MSDPELPDLDRRVSELERRMDIALRALDIRLDPLASGAAGAPAAPASGGLSPTVQEALDRGNKIEAVKRLHQETGMGLAAAKDEIERLTA